MVVYYVIVQKRRISHCINFLISFGNIKLYLENKGNEKMRKVIRIKIYAKELRNVYSLNDFRFFFLIIYTGEMLIIIVFKSVFFMVIVLYTLFHIYKGKCFY